MLPDTLATIDLQMKVLGKFSRVKPNVPQSGTFDSVWAGRRLEGDYDHLFANGLSVIEDLLRRSEDIEPDSKLRLLSKPGEQVLRIDLLLAEVGPGDDGEFRRLVLVEDKLRTNSESRREVLAQILDYARIVEQSLTAEHLSASVVGSEWLEDNRDEINRAIRSSDYLLIICGNEIHSDLIDLLKSYIERLNPLNTSAVILMEMAIYTNQQVNVFVPHIVGGSTRATRDITIRVVVETPQGETITPALVEGEATRRDRTSPGRGITPPDVFMAGFVQACGQQAATDWATLASAVADSNVAGIAIGHYDGGAPYIYLSGTPLGTLQLLRLGDTRALVRDRMNTRAWDSNAVVAGIRQRFRDALLKRVSNAVTAGKDNRVWAPVADFANARQEVVDAIIALAAELRAMTP